MNKQLPGDIYDILGFGVLQYIDGELHHEERDDMTWNIVINNDSNVLSFRFDDRFRLNDAQRVLLFINNMEQK